MDVSVVCPVFNTDPTLLQAAIRSVLNQSGSHSLELILVDDASTNASTCSMLVDIGKSDARVRVIYQGRNTGPGQARAAGVSQAVHEWIGFIDSDDLWPSDKLNQADRILRDSPDTRWVAGSHVILRSDGERQPKLLSQLCSSEEAGKVSYCLTTPALTKALISDMPPLGASLIRKSLFLESGGFDRRLLYGEDWLFYLRLSTREPMQFSDYRSYVLRRQHASMMWSAGSMSRKFLRSAQIARRDPALKFIRRELRWFYYATLKGLAMNNAINNRKIKALFFAAKALFIDPRELREFTTFVRALMTNGKALDDGLRGYSTADQIDLTRVVRERQ
ncbi:MAG: glycosyltransferase [Acidobacteriaceae bacterium]|nr:glycosyltransferase [Acidobacteriaceae bacterium]MBV8520557.1 glycosyltransferase [Acetobacteraceae bacterium]